MYIAKLSIPEGWNDRRDEYLLSKLKFVLKIKILLYKWITGKSGITYNIKSY